MIETQQSKHLKQIFKVLLNQIFGKYLLIRLWILKAIYWSWTYFWILYYFQRHSVVESLKDCSMNVINLNDSITQVKTWDQELNP